MSAFKDFSQGVSLFVERDISTRLHLYQLPGHLLNDAPVAFLLHGAIENGRIFYSAKGRGLAPFLAAHGWQVYVADLAGRGLSSPPIHAGSFHSQTDSIVHEIPALLQCVRERHPQAPLFGLAHSWGGVLLAAVLARFPLWRQTLRAQVYFGSKRTIRVQNREKWLKVDLFWNRAALWLSRYYGYLPARQLGVGADSETRQSLAQSVAWVRSRTWCDSEDGFDYGQALRAFPLPPTLYLAGQADAALGHPADVRDLMDEVRAQHSDYWLLGRRSGYLHDYGHIDMLTHPDAVCDHFPRVLEWMQGYL
ncbi:MAG: alpha/beta fold hydrolase [Candidatus Sericytochromatia bacterium]